MRRIRTVRAAAGAAANPLPNASVLPLFPRVLPHRRKAVCPGARARRAADRKKLRGARGGVREVFRHGHAAQPHLPEGWHALPRRAAAARHRSAGHAGGAGQDARRDAEGEARPVQPARGDARLSRASGKVPARDGGEGETPRCELDVCEADRRLAQLRADARRLRLARGAGMAGPPGRRGQQRRDHPEELRGLALAHLSRDDRPQRERVRRARLLRHRLRTNAHVRGVLPRSGDEQGGGDDARLHAHPHRRPLASRLPH